MNARFEIGNLLKELKRNNSYHSDRPFYWLDLGNFKHTGQAILSTILITDEFKDLLEQEALTEHNEPSCSTAEALEKQELFINPEIANKAASLLWQLFRNGMTENRGFFMNLNTFQCKSLKTA